MIDTGKRVEMMSELDGDYRTLTVAIEEEARHLDVLADSRTRVGSSAGRLDYIGYAALAAARAQVVQAMAALDGVGR